MDIQDLEIHQDVLRPHALTVTYGPKGLRNTYVLVTVYDVKQFLKRHDLSESQRADVINEFTLLVRRQLEAETTWPKDRQGSNA